MALFPEFPFPLNSVIVFLHRNCSVGCDGCSAGADMNPGRTWRAEQMKPFLAGLSAINAPGYAVWTGGEPFLTPELLLSAVRAAKEFGFQSEILTSAGIEPSSRILKLLGKISGTRLRISVDALHQRHVPLEMVARMADAARDNGLKVCFTVRDIPDMKPAAKLIQELRTMCPELFRPPRDSRFLHRIPHVAMDRGICRASLDGEFPLPELFCRNGFRDLVVGEDGNIYPCCGCVSFPARDLLVLGEAYQKGSQQQPFSIKINPLVQTLLSGGPSGLARAIGIHPHSICPPPLNHPCRLCYAIFNHYHERIRAVFGGQD